MEQPCYEVAQWRRRKMPRLGGLVCGCGWWVVGGGGQDEVEKKKTDAETSLRKMNLQRVEDSAEECMHCIKILF